MYDVFISYRRTDADAVRALALALRESGLAVWLDGNRVEGFTSMQRAIENGLDRWKALAAWYSIDYPVSRACQWELTRAFTLAQREGDPRRRILLINPEPANAHIPARWSGIA